MNNKRLLTKMAAIRDAALEHGNHTRCEDCKIRDVCNHFLSRAYRNNSSLVIECSWVFLIAVATGRIYRTGRLRKVKNYQMGDCNELFNHFVAFRKKYGSKCHECLISKECTQLNYSCYFSFLLCVMFGIIDVSGNRKVTQVERSNHD